VIGLDSRKRHPYTKPLFLKKAGTGAEYLKDDPVQMGRVLVLTSIACEDETSALTDVRIGKFSAGAFLPWEEQKTPVAGELVFSQEEHWIREGEQFAARFNGGAASDVCKVYLDGYWFYWSEKARAIHEKER